MENLGQFIIIIPCLIFSLISFAGFMYMLANWYQSYMWDKIDSICDDVDFFKYVPKKQNKKEFVGTIYGSKDFVVNLLIESFKSNNDLVNFSTGGYCVRGQRYFA